MNLLRSLESAGIDLRKQKKEGEYLAICPNCQKLKLSINVEKSVWQCWTCSQGGGISALSKWLGIKLNNSESKNLSGLRRKYIEVKPLEHKPIIDNDSILPKEFIPLINQSGILGKKAYDYVKGRGLTDGAIKCWGLGYCATGKYRNMIVIPVEDTEGIIRTFQTRRFYGMGSKNMNPPMVDKIVFNLRHAQGHPGIVIVEGPWDCIAQHNLLSVSMNISSVALLGHTCSQEQARQIAQFLKPEYIWISLDPDVTELEREKISSVLLSEGLQNIKICHPSKDPDELSYDESVIMLEKGTLPTRRRVINV